MKKVMVQDLGSAHARLAKLAMLRRGRLVFDVDAPIIPSRETVCMTSEALASMNAAWLLMGRTAALIRCSSENQAEAAMMVLTLRPFRRLDGKDSISVHVSNFNGNTLAFRLGSHRWDIDGLRDVVGTGHGSSFREALNKATVSLLTTKRAPIAEAAMEALGIWTTSMEMMASHILSAWDSLPGSMTEEDYRSLPPYGAEYGLS